MFIVVLPLTLVVVVGKNVEKIVLMPSNIAMGKIQIFGEGKRVKIIVSLEHE